MNLKIGEVACATAELKTEFGRCVDKLEERVHLKAEKGLADVEQLIVDSENRTAKLVNETEDRVAERLLKKIEERDTKQLFAAKVRQAAKQIDDSGC